MRIVNDAMNARCERCKGEGIIAGTRKRDGSIDTCPNCKGSGLRWGYPARTPKGRR